MVFEKTIAPRTNGALPSDHPGPWQLWVEDAAGVLVLVASAHDSPTAVAVAEEVAADLGGRRVAITYPDDTLPLVEFRGGRVTRLC